MSKLKPCRSYEFTGDILDDAGEYRKFINGLSVYLKSKLHRIEVKGRYSYDQYTCGKLHDRRDSDWKPWQNLCDYCLEVGYDPYAVRDAIEERLGVKLECECQILNNEVENRRKALANAFGANLGEPGRDFDFF